MCAGVLCVSSGELISGCDPPGACQLSRIPGTFGEQLESARSLVEDVVSGAEIVPFQLWLSPACLSAASGHRRRERQSQSSNQKSGFPSPSLEHFS